MTVILHLSDLHFGQERNDYLGYVERDLLLGSLLKAIAELPGDWKPNAVCISGDLGFAGKKADYDKAGIWLRSLLSVTGLSPTDLLACPGNHDLDRDAVEGMPCPDHAEAADRALSLRGEEPRVHRNYTEPFDQFASGLQSLGVPPLKVAGWNNYLVGARIMAGVQFIVLNTAWFSRGDQDKGRLWLGHRQLLALQVDGALGPTDSPPPFRFVVMHHPPTWLHDGENVPSLSRFSSVDYLARRSHVILTGHTHCELAREPDTIHGSARLITAGATFAKLAHPNQAGLIRLEQGQMSLRYLVSEPGSSAPNPWVLRQETYPLFPRAPLTLPLAPAESVTNDRSWRLAELARLSRARCIERWQAAGVSYADACNLADDPEVGAPGSRVDLRQGGPVMVLVAEVGAGKSLVAERFHQLAIKRAIAAFDAPLPVYLEAGAIEGGLQTVVTRQVAGLGDPRVLGATIVINGADEVAENAPSILREARLLANSWPNTRVVITSRPLPSIQDSEEMVMLEPLSKDEAFSLVRRFAGAAFRRDLEWALSSSVLHAIRRPLFAILLGVYLKDQDMKVPPSLAELLTNLVSRSLRSLRNNSQLSTILHRLAVLTTDRSGPVPECEVGQGASLEALKNTGLVTMKLGTISYALPILAEWFAAQSLAAGEPTISELIRDTDRLRRWKAPLAIAVGVLNHAQVSCILDPLVQHAPGVAAWVVTQGLAQWGSDDFSVSPTPTECGERVRAAMEAWVRGFGPIAPLIAPIRSDGQLASLGARTVGSSLTVAWYEGLDPQPAVVSLPAIELKSPWGRALTEKPGRQSAWAWRWTLNSLTDRLREVLEEGLVPTEGFLAKELAWKTACQLTGRSVWSCAPIDLSDLNGLVNPGISPEALVCLNREIASLRARGENALTIPWPLPPSVTSSTDILLLDDADLVPILTVIHRGAMDGYTHLVNTWLPNFRFDLELVNTLPARLVGRIGTFPTPSQEPQNKGSLFLAEYLIPLPVEAENEVCLSTGDLVAFLEDKEVLGRLSDGENSIRQRYRFSITITGIRWMLDEECPATRLAHHWLSRDIFTMLGPEMRQ